MQDAPAPAHAAAASADASTPAGPAKGILLRVKRRRTDAAVSTLVVSSEETQRREKRAALLDLREKMGETAIHGGMEEEKSSSAVAASSPTSAGGFRSKPAASAATQQRVFRLLTSIAAPRSQHGLDSAIQARIQALRQKAMTGGSASAAAGATAHPSLQPSSEEVHQRHVVSQTLSTQDKRELALRANRDKLVALHQSHLGPRPDAPQLVHDSSELQLQILDVDPRKERLQPGKTRGKDRETFAPPALTAFEARREARLATKAARVALAKSSHGSTMSMVDPVEAGRQYVEAMAKVKAMPDRKGMEAFRELMADYMATLPMSEREIEEKKNAAGGGGSAGQTLTTGTPSLVSSASSTSATTIPASSSSQSSSLSGKFIPNVPRRRKPHSTQPAPVRMEGDDLNEVHQQEMLEQPIKPEELQIHERPTAGGRVYDPSQLVHATATSMHGAPSAAAKATSVAHVEQQEDEDDESQYVYDVYHMDDAEPAVVASTGSASSIADGDDESYKSQYHGASTGYVTVKDGMWRWMAHGQELVNPGELSGDEDNPLDPTADIDEDNSNDEVDGYDDDEDEEEAHGRVGGIGGIDLDDDDEDNYDAQDDPDSDEDFHGRAHNVRQEQYAGLHDPRDPTYSKGDPTPEEIWKMGTFHTHGKGHPSLKEIKHSTLSAAAEVRQGGRRQHGFLDSDEKPHRSEEIASEHDSSDDDEACVHAHPQQDPDLAADDAGYEDTINEMEEMDEEREAEEIEQGKR